MTTSNNPPNIKISLPDHTQLPESDSTFSNNQPNTKIFVPDHTHLPESEFPVPCYTQKVYIFFSRCLLYNWI